MDKVTANKLHKKLQSIVSTEFPDFSSRVTGSFGKGEIRFTVKLTELTSDGTLAYDKEAENWNIFSSGYGLKKEWLQEVFQHNDHYFTITGLNTRSRKYPICVTRHDGKKFKYPIDLVKMLMLKSKNPVI